MRDKSLKPSLEGELYKHFKGDIYQVIDIRLSKGNHDPDDEWRVAYDLVWSHSLGRIALGEHTYTRPYEEFIENVPDPSNPDYTVPRYQRVDAEEIL